MVQNWCRVPYLISLERVVEGSGADNLTHVIIDALTQAAKMERLVLAKHCCALEQTVLVLSRVQKLE